MTRSSSFLPEVADNPGTQGPATKRSSTEKSLPEDLTPETIVNPEPLDLSGLLARAHHPGAGAVVLFSGEVRDKNHGRTVVCLEYEAYAPLATKLIREILAAAKEKWILHIALAQHRIGRLAPGEAAVVVITSSAHRAEAYAANRYIIDRIKHEAPIWKCEYYEDGTHEWGNNCSCAAHEEE